MRVLAYLDPGSASVMLQAIVGGAAAVLVSIKMFGKRVFRTLMFWKKDDEQDEKTAPASKADTSQNGAGAESEARKEPVS